MLQSVIGGISLGIVGVLLLAAPKGVWKAAERWKQKGAAEASPAFLLVTRIVGGVMLFFGVLVALGILK